jgi:hypothetical protein
MSRVLGRFGVGTFWGWDVLWLGTFCSWDVMGLGCFRVGTLRIGTFCICNVFGLGRFVGALLNAFSQKNGEIDFCYLPELKMIMLILYHTY